MIGGIHALDLDGTRQQLRLDTTVTFSFRNWIWIVRRHKV